MIFGTKPLDEIEESDLQALLDNPVPERKRIEYKSELPTDRFKDRKEFLADVSSFANTVGGYLVYRVREEDGMPVEMCGVEVDSVDVLTGPHATAVLAHLDQEFFEALCG